MKLIQFPVIKKMCFYHYLISWGPVDIFIVDYEIPSNREVPLFVLNLYVEFSTTDSEGKKKEMSLYSVSLNKYHLSKMMTSA